MSSSLQSSLRSEVEVAYPPIELWQAFTRPAQISYWLGDAVEIDLRVGGAYIVRCSGGIRLDTTVERHLEGRRLVLRPTRRGDDARVEIDLVKLAGAQTRISVSDPDQGNEGPWREALENLRSVWEQGVDLREARVAVLGVDPRTLGAADRPVRGVPPGAGVRLSTVKPGGPAHAAGLRDGDVVLRFDGQPVASVEELVRCIRARKPGEAAAVHAVRDGQESVRTVILGRRDGRGEPPPDPRQLVRRLREAQPAREEALNRALKGLSDEAAYRPERPDAWSVAQVLAHLSLTERMLQCWLDQASRGERGMLEEDACRHPSRLAAVLDGRPSVHELTQRLRRDERETVAYLEHLPTAVSGFKPLWSRVAFLALDTHGHSEDHLGQIARIRAAIGDRT